MDPLYYHRVILKIKLSGAALTGQENNTCMITANGFSKSLMTKYIFYKPELTFNQYFDHSVEKIHMFEVYHVPSKILEPEWDNEINNN